MMRHFHPLALALMLCLPAHSASFSATSSSSSVAQRRSVWRQQRVAEPAMMAKKITKIIKLALPAGKANPAPPIGPALGAAGCNIMMFCKEYNARTQDQVGTIVPVEISVFEDRSFTFILKTPPCSELLKKAAKIDKGSGKAHLEKVGKVTRAQLEEIAKTKMKDLTAADMDAAVRTIAGSARSMGLVVEGV